MLKLIVFLVAALAFGYYAYTVFDTSFGTPEPVACPADAKLCPDGSSVGRFGPDCSFLPCSGE